MDLVHFNPLALIHLAQLDYGAELSKKLFTDITAWKLAKAVIMILLAYALLMITQFSINWLSERVPLRSRLTVKQSVPFWKGLILLLLIVYLLNLFLNLSQSNFLALTGTLIVTLGFAFKDYVSSIIAGVVALFEAPYRVGDRVEISGYYGEVTGYGLRGIQLQTADGSTVTIPHSKTWTDPITNANSGSLEAQVVTDFFLNHTVEVDRVLRILYQAAYSSKYTQLSLPTVVVVQEEGWGTRFKLKSYPMDARDEFLYKTDLIRRAKQAFAQQGITYPKDPDFSDV